MKKKFISLLFLPFGLIPLTSLGQISSGTILMNGSIGFSSENTQFDTSSNQENYKSNGFSILPKIGYFLSENLAVGVGFTYSTYRQKSGSTIQNKNLNYSFGPFVRYYKFLGEKTAIFGNAAFDYSKNITETFNSNLDLSPYTKYKNVGVYFTPGLTYFASSKIGLEISLGSIGIYKNLSENYINTASYYEMKRSGLGTYFGLANTSLGINFYLGR